MSIPRRPWTRAETMLVYRLYCEIPFGSMHRGNARVIAMAERIGRSPSSVALKLGNFAHLDPVQRARGIGGMANVSALDREVASAFAADWDAAVTETEFEPLTPDIPESIAPNAPTEATASVKIRLTHRFFRRAVLASYQGTCCVCLVSNPRLIIASHIMPWSVGIAHRTDPRNGLALCALHDRAFDAGLMTITLQQTVQISPQMLDEDVPVSRVAFHDLHGSAIKAATKFSPNPDFLRYHNENIFVANG